MTIIIHIFSIKNSNYFAAFSELADQKLEPKDAESEAETQEVQEP